MHEVFKHKVTYNHKNAASKVRPMLQITDEPNRALREQAKQENINWIKLRRDASQKYRASMTSLERTTGNIPKQIKRPVSKEGRKVLMAHEQTKPMIGPLTAARKSVAAKQKYSLQHATVPTFQERLQDSAQSIPKRQQSQPKRRPQTSYKKRIEQMHRDLKEWGIDHVGHGLGSQSDMDKDLFDKVALQSVQSSAKKDAFLRSAVRRQMRPGGDPDSKETLPVEKVSAREQQLARLTEANMELFD